MRREGGKGVITSTEGAHVRGRTLAGRGGRETDDSSVYRRNKGKRMKNGEDDGVRLSLSRGGRWKLAKICVRACVSGGKG